MHFKFELGGHAWWWRESAGLRDRVGGEEGRLGAREGECGVCGLRFEGCTVYPVV